MTRARREMGRRTVLARIGLIALLPSLASPAVAQAQGPAGFQAPAGPMLFTRRLMRELPDGAAIIVTRTFEIDFLPMAGGFRVEGRQVAAHVEAPPRLNGLARLEEQRQETGLFPMQLDGAGRIVAGPGGPPADLGHAVDEAFGWIARNPMRQADHAAAQEFVIGLQTVAARITTALPPDLFTGNPKPLERTQDLTMPDGLPGKISVSYTGTARSGGGLLARAQRIVTTEASGSVLRSVEEWTLQPAMRSPSR